ncbi:sprT-like domain-containing protein Spartan [Ctenocephalides felis]|uniref:sprT-like domain-containing protein Spartan n=1 Tax=Ctenocephalides felis TaxID=7515 RepID=UPI000E6E562D|nr:sprT-like domain-containing protein Spartan [Ctenocephalides felis]
MSCDDDFALALVLQNGSFMECSVEPSGHNKKKPPEKTSLADPSWELIDPTPDIIGMFIAFDMKFFWGQLKSVVIRWSKRMYSCAGICSYSGRGGMCTISLSEPLLKLRPRKDTVETLLHEMIHAYLFVTHNNKDRSGHGPEFHKHMYRINAEAGVNITVYHSFHDEVNHYKTHWWRCNGPCRSKAPYFGTVKRSSNRAPGPSDFWWNEHKITCGGTWEKVKEPDNVRKKQVLPAKSNVHGVGDIQKYFNNNGNPKGLKSNRSSTLVITKPPQTKTATEQKYDNKNLITNYVAKTVDQTNTNIRKAVTSTSGNLTNVKGFKNFDVDYPPKVITPFTGTGNNLRTSNDNSDSKKTASNEENILLLVRNHWTNKFNNTTSPSINNKQKKIKLTDNVDTKSGVGVNKFFENSNNTANEIPTILIDDDDDLCFLQVNCPVCNAKVNESDINTHLDACMVGNSTDLDESMENEFTKDFVPDTSLSDNDLKKCPLCNVLIPKSELSNHLDLCATIDFGDVCSASTQNVMSMTDTLKTLGYSEDEIKKSLYQTNTEDKKPTQSITSHIQTIDPDYWNTSVNTQPNKLNDVADDESYLDDLIINDGDIPDAFPCPSCSKSISLNEMNSHLDICL